MITAESFGVIIALVVAFGGFLMYRDKRVRSETTQENKLDTIGKSVTEIRDDVKLLKGLDTKVENLSSKVDQAQKTADTAHERIDNILGVERGK